MNLAFIVPTFYLQKFATQGDFYLALAHLIDDNGTNAYTTFHRREAAKGKRIVLDNGLFEGAQVDPATLVHRAGLVNAQTVCAPDVLYDSKGTIKEFKNFIKLKQEEGLVCNIMGIPQASNPANWWECFQFMDMHPECHLIGLSILSIERSFQSVAKGADKRPITASRVHLIKQLYSYSHFSDRRITPCHLLGLGESYADIIYAKRLLSRDIVSNDSSSAFVHGLKGQTYDRFGALRCGKDREKLDFDFTWAEESAKSLIEASSKKKLAEERIQKNIDTAKSIARRDWFGFH